MRPRQLTLDMPFNESFAEDDFIVSLSNNEAYQRILQWPNWIAPTLALVGEAGVGKSHLASIWAERAGARRLSAKELYKGEFQSHFATGALLLEDVRPLDALAPFFHLLNLVKEEQVFLLITTQTLPSQWVLEIKDITSRLRAIPYVSLNSPDDELLKAVYLKFFIDRQMQVDTEVLDYMLTHANRSLGDARKLVAQLDKISLEKGRKITKLLVSEVLINDTTR